MSVRRILVISLGNPAEYRGTYHSAGHTVLQALQRLLGRDQPPFSAARIGGQNPHASVGRRYTLVQSPTLMNVSGPWVARAYREQLAEAGLAASELGLVLVHDDLEEPLGVVKVRDWNRSHRGHNGVKSVNGALRPPSPGAPWARVSVGIGRPEHRDRASVSDFVLSKMPRAELNVLDRDGGSGLFHAIAELEARWGEAASRL